MEETSAREHEMMHGLVWFGLVWFGLVGFSFNASLEPQPRARRRARLAEDAGWLVGLVWFGLVWWAFLLTRV